MQILGGRLEGRLEPTLLRPQCPPEPEREPFDPDLFKRRPALCGERLRGLSAPRGETALKAVGCAIAIMAKADSPISRISWPLRLRRPPLPPTAFPGSIPPVPPPDLTLPVPCSLPSRPPAFVASVPSPGAAVESMYSCSSSTVVSRHVAPSPSPSPPPVFTLPSRVISRRYSPTCPSSGEGDNGSTGCRGTGTAKGDAPTDRPPLPDANAAAAAVVGDTEK